MKLTPFYCFSLTFLGCILVYIANKAPEYLRKDFFKQYNEQQIDNIQIKEYKESGVLGKSWNIKNSTKGNKLKSFDEIPLEQAIRNQEIEEKIHGSGTNDTLIRKRRFLIFPEGSSFQLVFCTTYFTIIPIADIFYMGATAALAWELPQDPYSPFDHHAEPFHRKDEGPVTYTDVKGSQMMNSWGNRVLVNKYTGEAIQPFAKEYYNKKYTQNKKQTIKYVETLKKKHKKLIINPVFAKRSVNEDDSSKKIKRKKRASISSIDIDAMHREQEQRTHLDAQYMDGNVIDFHKLSRYGLYEKLEKLIYGIGSHGRECVLKALCEIGQDLKGLQGTFLEEIMRVIFTLPQSVLNHAKYKHYEDAYSLKYTCANVYPKCSFSIKSLK